MTAELVPSADARFSGILTTWLLRKSANTVRTYSCALDAFATWLGEPTQLDAARRLLLHGSGEAHALVERYVGAMKQEKLAPNTVNHRLAVLRSLAKIARRAEIISWTLDVAGESPENVRETEGPTWETYCAILAAEPRTDVRCLLALLGQAGFRVAEVLRLEPGDIAPDYLGLAVIAKRSRIKQPRVISSVTGAYLSAWMDERGATPGPIFGFVYLEALALVKAAGLRLGVHLTPHMLSHTFGTRMADLGFSDSDMTSTGRWKDPRTVRRYLDRRAQRARVLLAKVTGE